MHLVALSAAPCNSIFLHDRHVLIQFQTVLSPFPHSSSPTGTSVLFHPAYEACPPCLCEIPLIMPSLPASQFSQLLACCPHRVSPPAAFLSFISFWLPMLSICLTPAILPTFLSSIPTPYPRLPSLVISPITTMPSSLVLLTVRVII